MAPRSTKYQVSFWRQLFVPNTSWECTACGDVVFINLLVPPCHYKCECTCTSSFTHWHMICMYMYTWLYNIIYAYMCQRIHIRMRNCSSMCPYVYIYNPFLLLLNPPKILKTKVRLKCLAKLKLANLIFNWSPLRNKVNTKLLFLGLPPRNKN